MINTKMNKINLNGLGTKYTVLNRNTKETMQVRVIDYADLRAAIGEFIGTDYRDLHHHMQVILHGFRGFVQSPYDISWYAATQDKFDISEAIIRADAEKNSIVVVEILPNPEEELDNGFKR